MNARYVTLGRRELWEHRALWMAPAIATGVLILLAIVGAGFAPDNFHFRGGPPRATSLTGVTPSLIGLLTYGSQIMLISLVTCLFYLLDCLYAERKDRSILFWKSLPVSDRDTVLTKFTLAILVMPVAAFLMISVTYPLVALIASLGVPRFAAMTGGWNTLHWLQAEGRLFTALLATLAWYAPIYAWFMLCSVVMRRSPITMSFLPFLVLGIGERIVLGSSYVFRFLGQRSAPVIDAAEGFSRPGLWLGLAVTAGMLYIVIRLRRYRDDT